jgi:TRAP transporter TAXI family solute receptor
MIRTLASAFALALGAALFAVTGALAQNVGIAASNPGSLYHSSASAVAKLANDKAGLAMTVHPFASATVYLPAVNTGEYAFGITNVSELRKAVTGTGHFEGRVHDKVRAVSIIYPLRVAMFVRADSDIKSMADLKGKRMTDGFNSQKTIPPMLDAQLATAGLTRKDIKPVNIPNVVAGANAFISGKADAFFFALGAAKVREANASVGGLRALDVANTADNLAKIREIFFEGAYLRPEKPHKRNIGVEAPMHVMTYDAALVASADTSEDAVYRLVKAMHGNKKDLAAVFGVFNLFNPKRMATDLGPVQWHPGTIKFLKEQGMWPPKG